MVLLNVALVGSSSSNSGMSVRGVVLHELALLTRIVREFNGFISTVVVDVIPYARALLIRDAI